MINLLITESISVFGYLSDTTFLETAATSSQPNGKLLATLARWKKTEALLLRIADLYTTAIETDDLVIFQMNLQQVSLSR